MVKSFEDFHKESKLPKSSKQSSSSIPTLEHYVKSSADERRFAGRAMMDESKVKKSAPKKSAPVSTPKKSTPKPVSTPKVKKKEPEHSKDKKGSLLNDIVTPLKHFGQAINPFDDVSYKEAFKANVKDALKTERSPVTKETTRALTRVANKGSAGVLQESYKKTHGVTASQFKDDNRGKAGKVADAVYDGTGYLIQALGATKALRAAGLGAKTGTVTSTASKALQLAKEGAIIGGLTAGSEVGVREAINGKDYSAKQNLKDIGLGVGTGLVVDPLLHGVGKGLSKGAEKVSSRMMKDLLPSEKQVVDAITSNKGEKVKFTLKRPNVEPPKAQSELPVEAPKPIQQPAERPKTDTTAIDDEISNVTRQLEELKNKSPQKRLTKTEVEDQLRSLDINDGHLNVARREGKINDIDFRRKYNENQAKRQSLSEQYKNETPDELKTEWNNDKKGFVLGDYNTRKVYGGGYNVQKEGQNLGKFRTEEEARRFMQTQVAKEKGYDFNHEVDGVLSWNSTFDDAGKKWNITSGDYSIHRGDKDKWTVSYKDKGIGTFKNEKKAREVAQRHFDENNPVLSSNETVPDFESIILEQKLNSLKKQKEDLIKPKTASEPGYLTQEEIDALFSPTSKKEPLTDDVPVPAKTNEPTQKPLERPQHVEKTDGERQHFSTVVNSEKSTNEFIDAVKRLDKSYTKISDKEAVDFANGLIKRDVEEAYQFVKNAERLDKRHTTVALRLIDEFQKRGQVERAVDLIEMTAREGTAAAQKLQSFSLYNRLSVEGQLIRAQRMINRKNDLLAVGEKKQVLDEKTIATITDSVQTMERMTGFKDAGNNIQTIMEGWKKGKNPTDDELDIVRSFMEDYKKYVGDLTPSKERVKVKSTDKRTRDKVVDFFNKEEELAKNELKRILGRANSLPVDFMLYASRYGAAKIAKGIVQFADFSEAMVKDLGEDIRPYMKQVWDRSAELFNLQSEKITTKRLSEIEKITNKALKDKTISTDEMDRIREFAQKISTMSGDTHLEAQMELQMTLNALEKPTFAQQLSTVHSISLLLNPLTMVRNIIGNEVGYRVDRIAKMITIPADAIRSKVFGTERTIVFVKPVDWKMFFGIKGYGKGFTMGAKGGLKGVNPFGLKTAYDIGSPAFSASKQMKENMNFVQRAIVSKFNPLHHLEKALNVSMRSFDTAGFNRAYTTELYHQATLKAVNEGLKGEAKKLAIAKYFREADENMIALAEEYGEYATFQNDTKLGNLLTKTKQGLNYGSTYVGTLGLKPTKEFGLGNAIIPYAKTPANIVMRALEYSPAGFLRSMSIAKDIYKYRNIKDTSLLQLSLGRAITGSLGLSMFGYILANNGVLTSGGNPDMEVASLERSAGKQGNSVNVSAIKRFITSGFNKNSLGIQEGDTFVSYDWMQPISLSLALGTGVNQSMKDEGTLNPLSAGMAAANSAGQTLIDMSVLSGLKDFLSTYNGKQLSDYFVDPLKNLPSAFVPTFLNQFRKLDDNTSRNTYSPDFKEGTVNKMKNRVPGVESSLPVSYDTLGKPREMYQDNTNNVFNVFFNPSFVSKYKPSPEAKFVLDYINKTGDKTVAPKMAPKVLDGIKLTGAQQSEMQRIMGEEVQSRLERLLPKLQRTSDTEKQKKILDDILRKAGDNARKEMRKELSN